MGSEMCIRDRTTRYLKVIISAAELNKYFGKDATPREMKDQIMSLLAEWKEKQPPERTAPEKKTDREK